ncbi:hypothetical protein LIER_03153 [Lithospermum erythrorhizon]|uniref:Uncharacterized protein n=1 Tax=Lithospermum erythrorhizon TaxID=34254 RepID=A0AAV3NTE0_LITER
MRSMIAAPGAFQSFQFISDWPHNSPDKLWALPRGLQLSGLPMSGCLSCSKDQISHQKLSGREPFVVHLLLVLVNERLGFYPFGEVVYRYNGIPLTPRYPQEVFHYINTPLAERYLTKDANHLM